MLNFYLLGFGCLVVVLILSLRIFRTSVDVSFQGHCYVLSLDVLWHLCLKSGM